MYRNYNGSGGKFGDTSVSATSSDQSLLSIYAAQRSSDSSLTLMIINKAMTTSVTGTVNIAGFVPAAGAQVYRYGNANLNAITPLAVQAIAGGGFTASFPVNSITLLLIPTSAPTVLTGAAGAIGTSSATLNGTANPNGTATTGHFEYGLTTAYGSTTANQALGTGSAAVSIGGGNISGLVCNTLYHFRATATNPGGTTAGSDQTFTTAACSGFTDDPLITHVTPIKAVHLTDIRSRVDSLRVHFGLAPFGWTNLSLGGIAAKAVHVAELRTALLAAYDAAIAAARPVTRPVFADDPLVQGQTMMKTIHIAELRAAVLTLEAHP